MPLQRSRLHVAMWLLAVLLLSLFPFVPTIHAQDVDCDQYNDVAFTFLEVDETGPITFDDLGAGYTYEFIVCEVVPDPNTGALLFGCDYPEEYYSVSTNSYQIADWDEQGIYWYGVTGFTPDECYISGRARDYNYTEPVKKKM
ncbi:MAG: hypothetical protein J4G17_04765 [Anaerolineae bacterium]|nr:hypothetical protein [Anaerolineae bacterium]